MRIASLLPPTGSFVIPDFQATGPTFVINLNQDAGVPDIIIPGLGGEEPDFPLSIPRFAYECPAYGNGEVILELVCSDGDLDALLHGWRMRSRLPGFV